MAPRRKTANIAAYVYFLPFDLVRLGRSPSFGEGICTVPLNPGGDSSELGLLP